jgi:hypothetical protein
MGCAYCGENTHSKKNCGHAGAVCLREEEVARVRWSEFVLAKVLEALEQVLVRHGVPVDLVPLLTQSLLVKAGRLSRPTELRFARQNRAILARELVPKRLHRRVF